MMIEIVVAPPVGSGIALGILDRHICAVEWAREIAAPRRLDARTVVVLLRQRELQLLEQDGPFGKLVRLLVDRVGAWLDVDVVIFREAGARLGRVRVKRFGASLATIKRNWTERRSEVHPFVEILWEHQIAGGGVLRQLTWPGWRLCVAAEEPPREYGSHDHAAHNRCRQHLGSTAHSFSP